MLNQTKSITIPSKVEVISIAVKIVASTLYKNRKEGIQAQLSTC